MMNNYREQYQDIASRIPHVNFPDETLGYQHVQNTNFILALPQGQKCVLWFTTSSTMNVCYLIEIDRHNRFRKSYPIKTCFHSSLSYGSGTIMAGVYFQTKKMRFVSTYDIYYYKGSPFHNRMYSETLELFDTIFEHEVRQVSYFKENVVLGLPIMFNGNIEHSNLLSQIQTIPYKIGFIQYRQAKHHRSPIMSLKFSDLEHPSDNFNKCPATNVENNNYSRKSLVFDSRAVISGKIRIPDMVFNVKPELQNDVYKLCTYNNGSPDEFYSYAGVQSYSTSVFMNKIFRTIKENINLDLLEESDDEEDFENISEDKYVNLDKSCKMVCRYIPRINKWEPYKMAGLKSMVSKINDIPVVEKPERVSKRVPGHSSYMNHKKNLNGVKKNYNQKKMFV
jgi:hypothetical protein